MSNKECIRSWHFSFKNRSPYPHPISYGLIKCCSLVWGVCMWHLKSVPLGKYNFISYLNKHHLLYFVVLCILFPLMAFQQQTLSYSHAPRTCIFCVFLICATQQSLHLSTWALTSLRKIENGENFKGLKSPVCLSSGRCEKMSYWDMRHCTCNKSFQSNFFFNLPLAGAECIWSSNVCVKSQTACSGVSFLLGLSVFFVLLPKWDIWKKARAPLS